MTEQGRKLGLLAAILIAAFMLGLFAVRGWPGSVPRQDNPQVALRVVLIPADGGTADGTLADYRPLFAELSQATHQTYKLTVTQSYGAAVQALCSGSADIAFLGPGSYLRAHERGCADLLAVGVRRGQPRYYSIILVREDSPIRNLRGMRGARLALGDVNSTSSFQMPLIMLLDAGIDPRRDLGAIRLTGSHPESLNALLLGHVDAAALSLDSYERALRGGIPGAERLRIVARSEPLPYPPFAISRRLPAQVRARVRQGFASLASRKRSQPGLPGYAGSRLDGYQTSSSQEPYDQLALRLTRLTPDVRAGVLAKAAER